MDPLTSLGLVGNAIQIITFASSLIKETSKFAKSTSQSLPENEWLLDQIQHSKALSEELSTLHQPGSRKATNADTTILTSAQSCQIETSNLIALLDTLKLPLRPDGTKSKTQAIRQIARSRMKASSIEASRRKLESLERQLCTAVYLGLKNSQTREFQDINAILSQHGDAGLLQYQTLQKIEREVAGLQEQRQNRLLEKIISSLDYTDRVNREDTIEEHHWTTYDWVMSGSPFKDWLTSTDQVFWICGHPGSGKSTLMKYIGRNLRTAVSQGRAPGSKRVLIGKHFFWVAGRPWQKSLLGLLQDMLFQILSSLPSLTKIAFPEIWSSIEAGEIDSPRPWATDSLLSAFQRVGRHADIEVILLIDGLDECEERHHHDLVHVIRQLSSIDNVRLCLSSRPWRVFELEFGIKTPKMLLQQLTLDDMLKYTCNRLQQTDPTLGLDHYDEDQGITDLQKEARQLVQIILDKADGVFFWLSLVLDTLCVRLSSGESLASLRRFVREFPSKLEDYFEQLVYERIAPTYRSSPCSETAMALKLALLGLNAEGDTILDEHDLWGGSMPFISFWLLRQSVIDGEGVGMDPQFGIHAKTQFLPKSELRQMANDTRKYLDGCCKDFLHVKDFLQDVSFRHRTAFDFLQTRRMQDLINNNVPPQFHNEDFWWRQMTISRMKICQDQLARADMVYNVFVYLQTLRRQHRDNFTDGFEQLLLDYMDGDPRTPNTDDTALRCFDNIPSDASELVEIFLENGHYNLPSRIIKASGSSPGRLDLEMHNLLAVACKLGSRGPPLQNANLQNANLQNANLQNANLSIVRQLLEYGADPNVTSNQIQGGPHDNPIASIWGRLLAKMFAECHLEGPYHPVRANHPYSEGDEIDHVCTKVFDLTKLMIENGANVTVRICPSFGECRSSPCDPSRSPGQADHELMTMFDILKDVLTPDQFIEIQSIVDSMPERDIGETLSTQDLGRPSKMNKKVRSEDDLVDQFVTLGPLETVEVETDLDWTKQLPLTNSRTSSMEVIDVHIKR